MSRRPLLLMAVSGAGVAGAALVWIAAFLTPLGRRLDSAVFAAFTNAGAQPLTPHIEGIAVLADPRPFVLIGLALTGFALVRRRAALAALVPAVLIAANGTTQGLKFAIPRLVERSGVGGSYEMAWPSGHSTASMSLALCAVLVASPRLRPAAAMVGAGYAVAVGYSLVALGYHLPSDVLGGYLIAATFAVLGAAALSALDAGRPHDATRPSAVATQIAASAVGAVAVVAVAGVAVLEGPNTWLVVQRAPAMAAGASIAALGAALVAGMAVALRR